MGVVEAVRDHAEDKLFISSSVVHVKKKDEDDDREVTRKDVPDNGGRNTEDSKEGLCKKGIRKNIYTLFCVGLSFALSKGKVYEFTEQGPEQDMGQTGQLNHTMSREVGMTCVNDTWVAYMQMWVWFVPYINVWFTAGFS